MLTRTKSIIRNRNKLSKYVSINKSIAAVFIHSSALFYEARKCRHINLQHRAVMAHGRNVAALAMYKYHLAVAVPTIGRTHVGGEGIRPMARHRMP